MSAQEISRVDVMTRVAAGTLTLRSAAAVLHVSYRQVKRIWRRYREGGARPRASARGAALESRPIG
jgi:hypothetical protein